MASDDSWLDDIWGVASDILSVFGLSFGDDEDEIRRARQQDFELYQRELRQQRGQQRRENLLAQQGMDLQERNFSFGKARFGKEFNLAKQQWLDQRRRLDIESRRTGLNNMMGGLMDNFGMRRATMDDVLKRMAV